MLRADSMRGEQALPFASDGLASSEIRFLRCLQEVPLRMFHALGSLSSSASTRSTPHYELASGALASPPFATAWNRVSCKTMLFLLVIVLLFVAAIVMVPLAIGSARGGLRASSPPPQGERLWRTVATSLSSVAVVASAFGIVITASQKILVCNGAALGPVLLFLIPAIDFILVGAALYLGNYVLKRWVRALLATTGAMVVGGVVFLLLVGLTFHLCWTG